MSDVASAKAAPILFGGITPVLRVQSLKASLNYYIKILGFKMDWRSDSDVGFASVSRGRCHIFLCEGDQGHLGSWVWIDAVDTEAVYEEYRVKGAKIRHPPTNYEWAYEMQVEDLDGNVLRLGADSKEDEPIGEWLDMRGDAWAKVKSPDGSWTHVKRPRR
jgi:predicted lactoylglutathione lyase